MHRDAPARWLVVALVACACGGEGPPNAPAAPGGGNTGVLTGGSGSSGSGGAGLGGDDDAGTGPVGGGFEPLRSECDSVMPSDLTEVDPDGTFRTGVTLPADLAVTRVETTWTGSCASPAIRVTLSDGRCPSGDDHEVEFLIDVDAIADGRIVRGNNELEAEPGDIGLRMRYRRPASFDPPGAGEWGTCLGANGTVDFVMAPGVMGGDKLRVRFTTVLTPCDEDADGTREVNGTFDVELRRGIDDLCPEP